MKRKLAADAQQAKKVTLYPDGKYRWYYEYPMLKNPSILITLWKVLLIASCAPVLVVTIADAFGKGFFQALWDALQVMFVVFGILSVLAVVAYLILAALYGWKYDVIFVMDEKGILHSQQPKQFRKGRAISVVAALASVAAGKPTMVSHNISAARRSQTYSSFDNVRHIEGKRKRNVIYLSEPLNHNQIYVSDEDYDFVLSYITEKCPKAQTN